MRSRTPAPDSPVEIDGYDVEEPIGRGAFSVVYRARQRSMDRAVAIKVLDVGFTSDTERRAFVAECHALGRVSHHPNIVTVLSDAMTADGRPCIVMELYERSYRERLDELGRLGVEEVLTVGVRIAGALQAAHDAGVLHRDVKPHNIFVSSFGDPALGDFGIAALADELTMRNAANLSVAYAPPEVLEDQPASPASDVYSLAATLHQLATGSVPFPAKDLTGAVRRILTDEPPSIDDPSVPTGLSRTLRRAMAKDPNDRPSSAAELAAMLGEVAARHGGDTAARLVSRPGALSDPPVQPRPRRPVRADDGDGDGDGDGSEGPIGGSGPPRHGTPDSERDDGRGPLGDGELTTTLARARPTETPPDAPPTPLAPPWRRLLGWSVLVALIVIVAVAALVVGADGSDEPEPDVVTPTAAFDDPVFELVDPPREPAIAVTSDGFEVSFTPAPDAASTQIIVIAEGGRQRPIDVDGNSRVIASTSDSLCVELRSVGERGRLSEPVGPICSG